MGTLSTHPNLRLNPDTLQPSLAPAIPAYMDKQVRDGSLYDAGQEYLRTAFITAIALAALFVLLDWGNTARLMLSRLCAGCCLVPPRRPRPPPSREAAAAAGTADSRRSARGGAAARAVEQRASRPTFVPMVMTVLDEEHAAADPFVQRELLTSLSSKWYRRPSQRQLVHPIVGSWRNYGRSRSAGGSGARTGGAGGAAEDPPDDWITDYRSGPHQLSELALTAKGHFHITYDHPAYEGRLGVTLWHAAMDTYAAVATCWVRTFAPPQVNRFGLEHRRPPPPPPPPPTLALQAPTYWSTWRATGIVLLQVTLTHALRALHV